MTSFDSTITYFLAERKSEQNHIGLHSKSHYRDYYTQKIMNNNKYLNILITPIKFVIFSNNF